MTGRDTGANSVQFGEYLKETVEDPDVESRWDEYVRAE